MKNLFLILFYIIRDCIVLCSHNGILFLKRLTNLEDSYTYYSSNALNKGVFQIVIYTLKEKKSLLTNS